jgi:Tfp pilus assembly protein PilO
VRNAKKKKLIIGGAFAAAVVVILLGGYMLVLSPKQATAARLQHEAADTQSKLTLALAVARHPAPGGATTDASNLFRLSKAMPDAADSSGAILDLVAAAKATGVTIAGLSTQDPLAAPAGGYELVPVVATLTGHYGQLTNFLARVRRLVAVRHGQVGARGRLFGVDSIALAPGSTDATTLQATVNFETYVYSTTVAATPTTTAPAPSSDLSAAGATN